MSCVLGPRVALLLLALGGLSAAPFALPARLSAQEQEQEAPADPQDEQVQAELARLEVLVQNGKLPKAITEVRKLYKSTDSLRAGFALTRLLTARAEELGKTSKSKAHPVLVEAGELARDLLADPKFPASFRRELLRVIYRQASSEAATNKADAAIVTLKALVELGFEDFGQIEADPDFAKALAKPEFQEFLNDARQAIVERFMEAARREIAAFESFPFDFNTVDLLGRPLSLEGLRGRIVIVDFWGTWCPPCRAEIPAFIRLKERYASDLEVVGLAYERGEASEAGPKVIEFGQKNGINYPCAIGSEETRDLVPEFRGYPTTLFIDRKGKVRMVTVGAESYERLESLVLAMLEEATSLPADQPSGR